MGLVCSSRQISSHDHPNVVESACDVHVILWSFKTYFSPWFKALVGGQYKTEKVPSVFLFASTCIQWELVQLSLTSKIIGLYCV